MITALKPGTAFIKSFGKSLMRNLLKGLPLLGVGLGGVSLGLDIYYLTRAKTPAEKGIAGTNVALQCIWSKFYHWRNCFGYLGLLPLRRVVSLSKKHLPPKSTGNIQEAVALSHMTEKLFTGTLSKNETKRKYAKLMPQKVELRQNYEYI